MKSPWMPEGTEVEVRFEGEGVEFRRFVDALIGQQLLAANLAPSSMQPNQNDHHPDGGVDTQVSASIPSGRTDYFSLPTIWQYRAKGWKETTPKVLANTLKQARFLKERLRKRDALRLCLPIAKPAESVDRATKNLRAAIRALSIPSAVADSARVLDGCQLAAWASSYPGIVKQFFYPADLQSVLAIGEWASEAKGNIDKYVQPPNWEATKNKILRHADFTSTTTDVVLRIAGQAGVGKSRFVYETLMGGGPQVSQLVLCTRDDQTTKRVADFLAGQTDMHAILVADESSAGLRGILNRVLSGHIHRVRVVAIDNEMVRTGQSDPELWLDRADDKVVIDVLTRNFSAHKTPADIGRIVHMTRGYMRFAADMCRSDEPVPPTVSDYLEKRFPAHSTSRRVLEALTLVTQVGFRGDHAPDLDVLLSAVWPAGELTRANFMAEVNRLHSGPGFVGYGSILYITPPLVAEALFPHAWANWVTKHGSPFFERLKGPPSLIDRLDQRMRELPGLEKERAQLGEYFRDSIANLRATDFADARLCRTVSSLIENAPTHLLAPFCAALERLSIPELLAMGGDAPAVRSEDDPDWGPRRYIVWLAERLAAFEEYFDHAARILLRLATAETEPDIGNNATRIWLQIHGIVNSGTELVHDVRRQKLERMVTGADTGTLPLLIDALIEPLRRPGIRMTGRPLFAGRPVPDEWKPRNTHDWWECEARVLDSLHRVVVEWPSCAAGVRGQVLELLGELVGRGHGDRVRRIIDPLTAEEIPRVRSHIQAVLERADADRPDRKSLEDWISEIAPRTVEARLLALTGALPWKSPASDVLDELARQVIDQPQTLWICLTGLAAPHGSSAILSFGRSLGRLDLNRLLGRKLIEDAMDRADASPLVTGYIIGRKETAGPLDDLIPVLDRQGTDPRVVLRLALIIGPKANPVERAEDSVRAGRLVPMSLGAFETSIRSGECAITDVRRLLELVLSASSPLHAELTDIALGLVYAWLLSPAGKSEGFKEHKLREQAWHVVESPIKQEAERLDAMSAFAWSEVVQGLFPYEQGRAMTLVMRFIIRRMRIDVDYRSLVKWLVEQQPVLATRTFLDELSGSGPVLAFLGDYKSLVGVLPLEGLCQEVLARGVATARSLARHLPAPTVQAGQPSLPPITEFVLKTFGDDERVFKEFAVGVHGHEMTWGSLVDNARAKVKVADLFLDHRLPVVRKWALREKQVALAEAEHWMEREEREQFEAG